VARSLSGSAALVALRGSVAAHLAALPGSRTGFDFYFEVDAISFVGTS